MQQVGRNAISPLGLEQKIHLRLKTGLDTKKSQHYANELKRAPAHQRAG